MKTRSEVEEALQKLLDYEYKKMWESLVLYGQYLPRPRDPGYAIWHMPAYTIKVSGKDKGYMNQEQFNEQYIIGFLTAYAAVHYVEHCQNGWPESAKIQPVEDAKCLADEAWEQYQEAVKDIDAR